MTHLLLRDTQWRGYIFSPFVIPQRLLVKCWYATNLLRVEWVIYIIINFMQHPSVNTILYDSNMHHRVSISSTIVSQPLDSACTYFGCYGAFRGFYYYTFSEVPCIVGEYTATS